MVAQHSVLQQLLGRCTLQLLTKFTRIFYKLSAEVVKLFCAGKRTLQTQSSFLSSSTLLVTSLLVAALAVSTSYVAFESFEHKVRAEPQSSCWSKNTAASCQLPQVPLLRRWHQPAGHRCGELRRTRVS